MLPEIRERIEPLLLQVVETGEAIWSEDLMLPLLRHDLQESSRNRSTSSACCPSFRSTAGADSPSL
ncbi:MAG: hypothetical protein ABW026_09870, partial [Microvirga sp.]